MTPELVSLAMRLVECSRHSPALILQDGLGMGLFIVRQAVATLGHRIDVASIPFRGSRFSIFANQAEGASDEIC